MTNNLYRDEDGTFPKWAFPGGYPYFYLMADNETMCSDCANREAVTVEGETELDQHIDKQWHIVDAGINWEDESLYCCHCNAKIESAYGEPDTEEKENKAAMSVRDLVLDMTGDGTCEQLGDVQGFGWYGLVLFSDRDLEAYPQLAPHKAAIVSEDNYGFKEVGLFESVAKAQEIWYDLEHECAKYDADLDSHL